MFYSGISEQREYEEFKVRINAMVSKAAKVPPGGWIMQDGTPWPGNNTKDHPGMIQVFLGQSGGLDVEGHELPRLVYVSREKRPGFQHHKKAGAMNALVKIETKIFNIMQKYSTLYIFLTQSNVSRFVFLVFLPMLHSC